MEDFGRWKVKEDKGNKFLCECDCGTVREVTKCSLLNGSSTSCGCIAYDKLKSYNLNKRKWLIGKKINMLTVVKENGIDKGRNVTYECKCDCGNIKTIAGYRLKEKTVFSCGCKQKKRKTKDFRENIGKIHNYLEIVDYVGKISNEYKYKYKYKYKFKCVCGKIITGPYNMFKNKNNSCGCIEATYKYEDITGKKYNLLTVVKKNKEKIRKSISWCCVCACGNTRNVTKNALVSGQIKSCGCFRKQKPVKNMIGEKFGGSTIIEEIEPKFIGKNKKIRVFLCKCSCGSVKKVGRNHLKKISTYCKNCKPTTKSNMINKVRGNYKVLKKVGRESYLCECTKCSTKKEFTRSQLVTNPKGCKTCKDKNKEEVLNKLIGKQYKTFKVLKAFRDNKIIKVEYQCSNCKKIKTVTVSGFNVLKECQCIGLENLNKKYIGKKYNRLTITKLESKNKVHVICECGKTPKPVNLSCLKNNTSKSCGCIKIEACKKRSGKNHPNWKGGTYHTESEKFRRSTDYKKWRNDVFNR